MDEITRRTLLLLLDSQDTLTAKEIASAISKSESSVKHNMRYLRSMIEKEGAALVSLPGKGICLHADQEQRERLRKLAEEQKDRRQSFNYRRKYIADILFEKNSNYTQQLLADDLHVSRAVIQKDLNRIEKWLSYYNIQLIRIRNYGLKIRGDEFDIREAIIDSNKKLMEEEPMDLDRPDTFDLRISRTFFNYYSKFYKQPDLHLLETLVNSLEREQNIKFADTSYIQLLEYIALVYSRIRKGCCIPQDNLLSKYKCTENEYDSARNILARLFPERTEWPWMEIQCLAIQISLYGCYDRAHYNQFDKQYYSNVVKNLVRNIKQAAGINIKEENEVAETLTELFLKKKVYNNYQPISMRYLIQDVKNNHPYLYGIVLANLRMVEDGLNFRFNKSDISYITMVINNAKSYKDIRISTVLVTSFDATIAKYLKNKIEDNVKNIVVARVEDFQKYDEKLKSEYDLVLTTVITNDPGTVKISRRVDEEDLRRIQEEADIRFRRKYATKPDGEEIITPKLILTNVKARTKEEVLRKGCDLLGKEGYVEEGFYETLLKRENTITTTIGNGIAMPHGFRRKVLKDGLAVIKLRNPIAWEEENVDLVFLFAIQSGVQEQIVNLFHDFYELISGSSLPDLKEADTPEKIYERVKLLNSTWNRQLSENQKCAREIQLSTD